MKIEMTIKCAIYMKSFLCFCLLYLLQNKCKVGEAELDGKTGFWVSVDTLIMCASQKNSTYFDKKVTGINKHEIYLHMSKEI
jgi:hypothetical protein